MFIGILFSGLNMSHSTHLPSNMLSYNFDTPLILQKAYMPFLKNGGLFIETTKNYKMGAQVVLLLNLPDKTRLAASGDIVWVNSALGIRPAGIGISFKEDASNAELKSKIEILLVGLPNLEKNYFTL